MTDRLPEALEWLRTTCDDEDGHTCEVCFQGNGGGCEYKYLAGLMEDRFTPAE